MWPNIFAPSFWTLTGIAVAHFHHLHHVKKQNDLLDPTTPGGITEVLSEVRKMNAGTQPREVNKETQNV